MDTLTDNPTSTTGARHAIPTGGTFGDDNRAPVLDLGLKDSSAAKCAPPIDLAGQKALTDFKAAVAALLRATAAMLEAGRL